MAEEGFVCEKCGAPVPKPVTDSLPRRIVVDADGNYWRDFGSYYSIPQTSDNNAPIDIVAAYGRRKPS